MPDRRQLPLLLSLLTLASLPAIQGKPLVDHPEPSTIPNSLALSRVYSAISITTHHRASHGSGGQEKWACHTQLQGGGQTRTHCRVVQGGLRRHLVGRIVNLISHSCLFFLSLQDGEPVNTNEKKSHRVLFKDGALFFYRTMQSKKEQDGGEYWCVAKNHVGKAVSRHASLQIAGKTLDLFTHCATICFMPCLTPLRYR